MNERKRPLPLHRTLGDNVVSVDFKNEHNEQRRMLVGAQGEAVRGMSLCNRANKNLWKAFHYSEKGRIDAQRSHDEERMYHEKMGLITDTRLNIESFYDYFRKCLQTMTTRTFSEEEWEKIFSEMQAMRENIENAQAFRDDFFSFLAPTKHAQENDEGTQ